MSLRRILGISLVIQIVGSLSTILSTIFITRIYGPAGQGYLSYFRSTVDLVVSIGSFGLPQAFVYLINSGKLTAGLALKFSDYYALLFAIVTACVASVFYTTGIPQTHGFNGFAVVSAVLASSGFLAHGLYRAIALAKSSASVFNLVTILPSIFLLIFYVVARPANYEVLVVAHVAASLLALIVVMALFTKMRSFGNGIQVTGNIFKSATLYGFWSFVPNVSLTLTTMGTYALLRQGSSADAAVGQFSVAVLILSAAVLPLNMVIPILFNAWSSHDAKDMRRASFIKLAHVGTLLSIVGFMLGVAFIGPLIILVFGREMMPSIAVTQIMLVSIFALYQNRLSTALLLALGKPEYVAVSATIRMIVIMILMMQGLAHSITSAALAWIIAEFISVSYMLFKIIKLTGWPALRTLGLSPSWVRENIPAMRKAS